jgi:hypothetical protein
VQFRAWKVALREEVSAASGSPDEGFRWIHKVESVATRDVLADPSPFHTLDVKLTAALTKICKGDIGRQIMTAKETAIRAGQMLRGRQILHMVYEHFSLSEREGALYDIEDLLSVKMRSGDAIEFITNWDSVLAGMRIRPNDETLEVLFLQQMRPFPGLQHDLAEYDRQPFGSAQHSYDFLYSSVKRYIERERRKNTRNQLTRALGKGSGDSGNATPGQKGNKGAGKEPGVCFEFQKSGNCSRGADCKYRHVHDSGGNKTAENRGRSPNRSNSPQRGRSAGRKPSPGKKSSTCRFYMKGQCTKGKECEFAHPPACKYFKSGSCKLGKDCKFAHIRDAPQGAPAQNTGGPGPGKGGPGSPKSPKGGTAAIAQTEGKVIMFDDKVDLIQVVVKAKMKKWSVSPRKRRTINTRRT